MSIKEQYDQMGKDYINGQKRFFSKREDGAINYIKKSLPKIRGKKALDIGCGSGKDILLLESLGANAYGIDTSSFMIGEAKKRVANPSNLFICSIEKTPFENNFFDVAIGRFSFHYLKKFDKAYSELARVMKSRGIVILAVHHPFRDLTSQKRKVYGKQEEVAVELYQNKVRIRFPTHTMKDYFSDTFFRYFYLDGFEEEKSPEEHPDRFNTPGFMAIKAIRK